MSWPLELDATEWIATAWPAASALLVPFVLASLRFLGMLWMAPVSGSAAVPIRARVVLALLLGAVVAPVIAPAETATSAADLIWFGASELILGGALGFGVRLILTGLELAAGLIDQQSGHAMAQVLNPQLGEATTPSGPLLAIAGTFALLTALPAGGELHLTRLVLDTFRTLPPGSVIGVAGPVQFVQDVMLAAMTLGLQVAAPCVAALGLVQIGWGFVTRSSGATGAAMTLLPARLLGSLLILTLTLSGVCGRAAESIEDVLSGAGSVAASHAEERAP